MEQLPDKSTHIIRTLGDGFIDRLLVPLLDLSCIVVTRKIKMAAVYSNCNAREVINPEGLHKLQSEKSMYSKVVIDLAKLNERTRIFKALREVCKGKTVIYVQTDYDFDAFHAATRLLCEKTGKYEVYTYKVS